MYALPWIDISLPIDGASIAWTGIAPPRLTHEATIADGASVNVGRLSACLHTATHADAPSHIQSGAPTIEQMPIDAYIGPARLVRHAGDRPVTRASLEARGVGPDGPARLLIASEHPFDGRSFPDRVPSIDPNAARWLVSVGVRLVGVDVPSIDPIASKSLDAHRALLGGGVVVIENLVLSSLPEGEYDLVALPLRIVGGDASPVRAAVRPRA